MTGGPLAAEPMPSATQIALSRGLLAERTAECAALAEALDKVTHEFREGEPTPWPDYCMRPAVGRKYCGMASRDHLHRTSARVRAELGSAR